MHVRRKEEIKNDKDKKRQAAKEPWGFGV